MGIKVLLVEDDRSLREALADTLLLAGHETSAATAVYVVRVSASPASAPASLENS